MGTSTTAGPAGVAGILDVLRGVLPGERPVALHEPDLGEQEQALVGDCLDSGWISSAGRYVDRFEQRLAAYTGIPHAVATVNGTAALHTCLVLAGVAPGDEVITPALTFVGTINPIRYQGATPHFVDCEEQRLGIDPEALEAHLRVVAERRSGACFNRQSGRPIKAMIVVHVLGVPARMQELAAVAERWHMTLIEDAAESVGSWDDARHTGSWGALAALSFNGNKIISCGGGGAVLTRDDSLAQKARHVTTTAKIGHAWELRHDQVGYNYRLPNLNAAVGCAQLERLEDFLVAKARLYRQYLAAFESTGNAIVHPVPDGVAANHWLNLLLVTDRKCRDDLLAAAATEEIQLRPFWDPMHKLPMFAECPRASLAVTESLWARGVCLPSSPKLASPALT